MSAARQKRMHVRPVFIITLGLSWNSDYLTIVILGAFLDFKRSFRAKKEHPRDEVGFVPRVN